MKLTTRDEPVLRYGKSDPSGEQDFSIKATAKTFEVLSSKLYKDKIAAIVREISCNAYDAHVAAGCTDKPFKIQLPSAMDPNFVVRDYGKGLTDHQIRTVFTSFFESTKDGSDEFIGALGLGSKSPFSLVDAFPINSYQNGKCHSYLCFKENGLPRIKPTAVSDTDEPDGLEVIVPVQRQDFSAFSEKAAEIYRWFKVKPDGVAQIRQHKPLHSRKGEDGSVLWELTEGYQPLCIMGQVAYPLAMDVFQHELCSGSYHSRIRGMVLYFDIGELDIQAGREELSYDKATVENITKRLDSILEDIQQHHTDYYSDCKTLLDACIKYHRTSMDRTKPESLAHQFFCSIIPPKHNGVDITRGIEGIFRAKGAYVADMDTRTDRYNRGPDKKPPVFLLVDSGTMINERISLWKRDNMERTGYIIYGHGQSMLQPAQVPEFEGMLDGMEVAKTSQYKVVRQKAKVRYFTNPHSAYKLRSSDRAEVSMDMSEGGIFLLTKSNNFVQYLNPEQEAAAESIYPLVKLCSQYFPKKLFIVPWTRKEAFEKHEAWTPWVDALLEQFKKLAKKREFVRKLYLARNWKTFGQTLDLNRLGVVAQHCTSGHPVRRFHDLLVRAEKAHREVGDWLGFLKFVGKGDQVRSLLANEYLEIRRTYPLVALAYNEIPKDCLKDLAFYADAKLKEQSSAATEDTDSNAYIEELAA